MKTANVSALILFVLIFASCMPFTGIVRTDTISKNEIVITPELRALLAANPRPKLVIRTPNPPTSVTELEKFNTYINIIEKQLLQSGFVVRDRALLENLMRSGSADYRSIQRTIDTDLIIDILALSFDISNTVSEFYNATLKRNEKFATAANYIDCATAKLECRLTIVEKGQLGGLFTLHASPCDGEGMAFFLQQTRALLQWPGKDGSQWYPALKAIILDDQQRVYTEYLTKVMLSQLVSKIQEAISF